MAPATTFQILIEKSVKRIFFFFFKVNERPESVLILCVCMFVGSFIFKPIRSWLELTEYEKGYSFIQLYINQAHLQNDYDT